MTTPAAASGVCPIPQPAAAPLTRAAIFLIVTINPGDENSTVVRSLCGDLAALLRAVGFREADENLSCIMAFGSEAWDRLFGEPRPAELHVFREIRADTRHAVSTPGDLLFHIRAERMDLCFELATQIMARLEGAVLPVDEVHGFRYFDSRDLLGFVDGTENPAAQAAIEATLIGDEDPAFAGGSYVIVQKYLHDIAGWNENGREIKIVRDNMPFGQAGQGEFGTYFIGYSRSPRTIEQMLENMFIGRPPGNYDRILDFSRAVTGNLFFVPSATFLDEVTPDAPPTIESPAVESPPPIPSMSDGSLGIGSLKGKPPL